MYLRKLTKQLLKKSEESILLALEIYNKPTVLYRLESFCIFFTNAWELILKAYLIEQYKSAKVVFLRKKPGEERKTISIDDCLGRIFSNVDDPIRKNIEDISELRNKATHLIIPELEALYVGLFQRGVINYVEHLSKWFSRSLEITPRLLTIAFSFNPENVELISIRKKYGAEVSVFYDIIRQRIAQNVVNYGGQYSIPLYFKLALIKNPKKADIILSSGQTGELKGQLIEVPRDPGRTHPYLSMHILEEFKKEGIELSYHDILCIREKENITPETKPEYMYQDKVHKYTSPQYSPQFIEFVKHKIATNSKYVQICNNHYRSKRGMREKTIL